MDSSLTPLMWIKMKEEIQENMMTVWPDIIRDVKEHINEIIPDLDKWEEVLEYNVAKTKGLHSITLIYAYKLIASNEQRTEDNMRLVLILAWCVEMLLAWCIIIDDIMDQSSIRRDQPCWYLRDGVGLRAINDSGLIQSILYWLLEKHFEGKECYNNLVKAFQSITFKGVIGQHLDMCMAKNLDHFTMKRYDSVAAYNPANFGFYFPTILVMHFVGITDPQMFKESEILLKFGHLYKIQDDCLGGFEESDVFSKDCTDIKEGKCTWLIVKALECATPEQRKIVKECYGVSDPEKIKLIKQLYIDLNLKKEYEKYQKKVYNDINEHIQKISYENMQLFLKNLLGILYRRRTCFS